MDGFSNLAARDPEIEAMETCFDMLERLEPFAQDRVLKYLAVRLSGGSENASAKDLVFAQIMREPGLRGNELVERLSLLNERTVRTCLHRLKYAEQIHQRDGKWHPSTTQAAPDPDKDRSDD